MLTLNTCGGVMLQQTQALANQNTAAGAIVRCVKIIAVKPGT